MTPEESRKQNRPLSKSAAAELVAHAAGTEATRIPLDEVFRALADDTSDVRLRHVSLGLAKRLADGSDLSTALAAVAPALPPYVRRTLDAAGDADQTRAVLAGLAYHETSRARMRRQMWAVFAYPLLVLILLGLLALFLTTVVAPPFREIYEDFDLDLPFVTNFLLKVLDVVPWLMGAIGAMAAGGLVMRLIPGGARLVDWLRTALPGVGKLWIFSGHHELASILHALTRQRIPLDAALRCTVASLRDRNLARALRLAGVRAGRGAALGSSMAESIHFDPTLTSLVRWGESNDSLPDALQQACQHFEGELDLQATFLSRVLPPFLLVAVTGAIFCVVIGLMAPIVPLMRGLMWW